jgi:hypothetical protein
VFFFLFLFSFSFFSPDTLAALYAPFPFIFGIHKKFVDDQKHSNIPADTVKVFLDENKIDFGKGGPAPQLPEKRFKKLVNQLKQLVPKLLKANNENSANKGLDGFSFSFFLESLSRNSLFSFFFSQCLERRNLTTAIFLPRGKI